MHLGHGLQSLLESLHFDEAHELELGIENFDGLLCISVSDTSTTPKSEKMSHMVSAFEETFLRFDMCSTWLGGN